MKSVLYFLIAALMAGAGYLGYERFVGSSSSADENTLAQAQGVPPPPARLPTLAQAGEPPAARLPDEEVTEEEEPEVEPTPTATPTRSYEPDVATGGPPPGGGDPNAMPDVSEEEFCESYQTHPRYNEFC